MPGSTPDSDSEGNDLQRTQDLEEGALKDTEMLNGEVKPRLEETEAVNTTSSAGGNTVANSGSVTQPAAPTPTGSRTEGEQFGDFRLVRKLGQGGMGEVYRAHQISMDRPVALKLLSESLANNQTFVDRFYREARSMARLDHPNIVRGYAVGDVDGKHFVAMEFVKGVSLQGVINKKGRLSVGDAVHIAICSADALEHAHEQGLVHRDIKPDNILISHKGVVKIVDMGLAKASDDDLGLTASGVGFGTPYYMPLEQYRDAKHADARSDIYALGVTLYHTLTGKLPFAGESHVEVIEAKQKGRSVPSRRHNPEIPDRLDLMVEKMMSKEPKSRYQNCADLIRDLESLGVANEVLSFAGAAGVAKGRRGGGPEQAATVPQRSQRSEQLANEEHSVSKVKADAWILNYRDLSGVPVKKKVSTGRLIQLVKRNEIDVATARVMRVGEKKPRPLSSYPEFESLVRSRVIQKKVESRDQRIGNLYKKIDRAEKRRQLFRSLGNVFRNLVSLIIVVAVLGGLAFAGWWFYNHKLSPQRGDASTSSSTSEESQP